MCKVTVFWPVELFTIPVDKSVNKLLHGAENVCNNRLCVNLNIF